MELEKRGSGSRRRSKRKMGMVLRVEVGNWEDKRK